MKLTKSKIFLVLCLSFLTGVLLAPVISKFYLIWLACSFIAVGAIGWSNKYARVVCFAGIVLVLGGLRYDTVASKNNMAIYYDHTAQVSGVVVTEPDVRSDKIYLTLGKLRIQDQAVNDKVLVSVYPSRNYNYGDRLEFTAKILEPTQFPDFDYKNYLSRYGIDAVVYYPQADIVANGQGNRVVASLLNIKERFVSNLDQLLPQPQSAFLAALLVGNKHTLPQNLTDDFAATGTSHMIAISGYNISIIVAGLSWGLSRFRKRAALAVSVLVIIAFVIFTGATASVIRAAIISSLILVALNIGRQFNITNALALTAAPMVAVNPKVLHYDVGFQLSFLALIGIVYAGPAINKLFLFFPDYLRPFLVATIAAQIFTLPILMFNFDQLSLIAPVANILVLPVVPLSMLLGFAVGSVSFVWLALSKFLAWGVYVFLSYIIFVIQKLASLPFASLHTGLNLYGVVLYYVAIASFMWFYHLREKEKLNSAQVDALALYKI